MMGGMKYFAMTISAVVLVAAGIAVGLRGQTAGTASAPAAASQTMPQGGSQPASQASSQPATTTQGRGTAGDSMIRNTIPIPPAPPAALGAGSLSGRLLDTSGKPVAGAIVTYSSRQPPAPGQAGVPVATSAPDGTFTLGQFPSGPRHCTLTITQTGNVIGTIELDTNVVPGQNTRLDGDIRLSGPTAVPVRVR